MSRSGGTSMSFQQNNQSYMPAPPNSNVHGGGFVPTTSQVGGSSNSQAHVNHAASMAHGGGFVPQSQVNNNDSGRRDHGGGYVPNQQPLESNPHQNLGPPQADRRYIPSSYSNGPLPGQAQAYQGQENYAPAPYTNGAQPQSYATSQPYVAASGQQSQTVGAQGPSPQKDRALAILKYGESKGIADTLPEHQNQHRRTWQHGYGNLLHQYASWRMKYPNSFQMPALRFRSSDKRRHRDIMQRVYEGPEDDRYLSPWDGHVAKLVVQATQEVYDGARNATWRRTFVRNVSPAFIHVANWPFVSAPAQMDHWTGNDWTAVCAKWLPACGALLCVLLWNPNGLDGKIRNAGFYDAFPYKHWGYPKAARNVLENPPAAKKHQGDVASIRVLGPRYLCFLNNPNDEKDSGVTVRKTDQSTASTAYIFIGYTTEQFQNTDSADMNALHQIAERAAREADVSAFWVAGSCMPDPAEMETDVYRISDVMRGAHSLAIIVGPSRLSSKQQPRDEMLRQWGTRMWTLPEALLSPSEVKIKVYTRDRDGPPWEIAKKHFAAVVWDDPLISRQLVDHYNKNLDLSRLELVTIALKCLSSRQTIEHFPGDLSYALMGLLRQRPTVDSTDTAFQAFARLSMANDSDLLLERLICALPKDQNTSWLSMDDAWSSSLWDIYPQCQVAGIGPGDTVLLDGAFGAAIRWKAFAPVAYVTQDSWKRLGSRIALHGAPLYFLTGIGLSLYPGSIRAIGIILLVLSLIVILASPYLTRVVYTGKLWNTQAWFQGFEGYMDLATIESHIFGAYMGRLKWSPAGSPLCRHEMNEFEECVGVDPMTRIDVRDLVEQAKVGGFGTLKVFTLVDTYTLTVTMFAAVRPPVAVLLCGREGGMQRAVMCSYDWATQTLYRETVLRMETPVLERMFRVHRFRFGLQRPLSEVE